MADKPLDLCLSNSSALSSNSSNFLVSSPTLFVSPDCSANSCAMKERQIITSFQYSMADVGFRKGRFRFSLAQIFKPRLLTHDHTHFRSNGGSFSGLRAVSRFVVRDILAVEPKPVINMP